MLQLIIKLLHNSIYGGVGGGKIRRSMDLVQGGGSVFCTLPNPGDPMINGIFGGKV